MRDEFLLNIHFIILLKLNSPIIAPEVNVMILSNSKLLTALIIVEYKPNITSIRAPEIPGIIIADAAIIPHIRIYDRLILILSIALILVR